mmetsp:Transcript_1143/g.2673  ORF Transcript_1143/g.2673 Transcript_1143/m.2673 type:complete len:81 (-) Transcript_1143:16-258(-)|eukprot:jgi/Tetstr1/423412/TSEL_014093.t1
MARKPAGKEKKETRSQARARKESYKEIHESAVWVLPTVGVVFLVVFMIIFWVASRKPEGLPPGVKLSNLRAATPEDMDAT